MQNENKKESQPYKCEQCGKQFSQRSSLNRHIREQHIQPGFYKCKKCGLRFSKKYNLQTHTKRTHSQDIKKNKAFKCCYCTCIFNRISVLKKHTKDYHEKYISLKTNCSNQIDLTEKDDNDPRTIAEQVLEELKQLQRDIQPENYDQFKPQANLRNSRNNNQEIFAVDSAMVKEITIKDKLYPLAHTTKHKVQIIKRCDGYSYYVCEYCSKEFKKSYDYLRHRRIHTKVRPFICVLCKKSFPTRAQLKTHGLTHKFHEKCKILKRFYKCRKCNDEFSSIKQLDKHLSSYLECNISFECPECLKSFKSIKSLVYHKHLTNDAEINLLKTVLPPPIYLKDDNMFKEYSCSVEQRKKRHQNLFKYQCNTCRGCKASLNVHKKQHLNQKKLQLPNVQ